MPSVSPKQRKFMQIAANSPEFRKKVGISKDVATEFHNADRKKARFQEGGEVRDRQRPTEGRSIVREPGREPRVYDPYEDLRRKYQTPGTVIRGDELPNARPSSRPNVEEGRGKKMAKGGKVGCGHGMKSGGKIKRYAAGGVTGRAYGMRLRTNLDDFPEMRMRKDETQEDYNERQYKAERAGRVPSWNKEMRDDYEMETGRKPRGKGYAAGGQVCRGMGAATRGGKYKS